MEIVSCKYCVQPVLIFTAGTFTSLGLKWARQWRQPPGKEILLFCPLMGMCSCTARPLAVCNHVCVHGDKFPRETRGVPEMALLPSCVYPEVTLWLCLGSEKKGEEPGGFGAPA